MKTGLSKNKYVLRIDYCFDALDDMEARLHATKITETIDSNIIVDSKIKLQRLESNRPPKGIEL